MLIEFTVKNFRSIKNEVTFTMLPEKKIKDHDTLLIETNLAQAPKLQKIAVIYGANASGKSNILKSLAVMRRIILLSATDSVKNQKLPAHSFKLSAKTINEPTVFSAQFISLGVRYHYGFAYNKERILTEFLDAYPKGSKQGWFERNWKDGAYEYKFSPLFLGEKEATKQRTRDNTLFLSKAIDDNNKMLEPVWEWFQSLSLHNSGDKEKTAELCKTDEGKAKVLQFLQDADIPISGINTSSKELDLNPMETDSAEEKEFKEALKKLSKVSHFEVTSTPEVKFIRNAPGSTHPITFDLDDESEGTQKLFDLAALWIEALEKQVPLFYDELDTKLHPNLQKYLVHKFANSPKSKAQLIFTSHNTNLLRSPLLRRDQFWFTELNHEQATELFPLTAVKEKAPSPRKGEALERGYLDGRYGGVPYLPSEDE